MPSPDENSASRFAWRFASFSELSPSEVYDILAARCDVFIVEQNCAYRDIDGVDRHAWHLFASDARSSPSLPTLAAYLRVMVEPEGVSDDDDVRIGRVLTAASHRGQGLGNAIIERALREVGARWPTRAIRLHAQSHLDHFYGTFGFEVISEVHDEDGIPHVWMRRSAKP